MLSYARHHGGDHFGAADDACQLCGKVAAERGSVRRRSGLLPLLAPDRRDKVVAAARDVGDEAVATPSVAERLAHRSDMDPQGSLVDDRVGPGAGDELILVNCIAGALNERE